MQFPLHYKDSVLETKQLVLNGQYMEIQVIEYIAVTVSYKRLKYLTLFSGLIEHSILFVEDKQCFFVTGYVDGEEDRSIGTANSAQECLDLIKNVERTADGMTWDSMSRKCFAEFGSEMIFSVCETCKACIFNGTF